MCKAEGKKTPSAELAAQAAAALLESKLIRQKDQEELQSALGIGTATAEQWISWLDFAMAKEEDASDD